MYLRHIFIIIVGLGLHLCTSPRILAQDNCMLACPADITVPDEIDLNDFNAADIFILEGGTIPDGTVGEEYCVNVTIAIPENVVNAPLIGSGGVVWVRINQDLFSLPSGLGIDCISPTDCEIPGGTAACIRIAGIPDVAVEQFEILGDITARIQSFFAFNRDFENISLGTVNIQSATLPIELISFSGFPTVASTDLTWTTASEQASHGFEIQKSVDGANFETIHFVASSGSEDGFNYSYQDFEPDIGQSYYRLKLIDLDGSYSFSEIIQIQTGIRDVIIYPNPAVDRIYVAASASLENLTITIRNELGQVVLTRILSTSEGRPESVNIGHLPPGVYFTNLRSQSGSSSTKLVKR